MVIETALKLVHARLASFLLRSGPAYSSGLSPDPRDSGRPQKNFIWVSTCSYL